MNKRIVSLVVVLTLLVGFSALGYGMMSGRNHRGYEERGWDGLDLSQEQSEEIDRLTEDHYRQARELSYELRDKRYELRELYFDAEVSNSRIEKQQAEVEQLERELDALRADYQLALRDILNTEQLDRMSDSKYMMGGMSEFDCPGYSERGSYSSHMGRGHHGGMMGW
ncbi:periplasmic heavy metal sensor [Natroniella sulfidigena]|uniref:Spy/CpxP family protein refolding chaperone n=1 Tax=Natroniella sulfidigena TaxID=723921 RepID=UPI00200B2555|nr:periplasmic heavy metal sensor [Natroniella sulfidigena]MCK8816834.1 periplasmic heavy metal sensor [Natroniella sulfidigena]